MKSNSVILLISSLLFLTTCHFSNFTKQKYTDLKPLSAEEYSEKIDGIESNRDSLTSKDEYPFSNSLKTANNPSVNETSALQSEENEESTTGINTSDDKTELTDDIELTEVGKRNFRTEKNKVKDEFQKYFPKKKKRGDDEHATEDDTNRSLKISFFILLGLAILSGIISLVSFYNFEQSNDGSCQGAFNALFYYFFALVFLYLAGILFLAFLILLIIYLVRKFN